MAIRTQRERNMYHPIIPRQTKVAMADVAGYGFGIVTSSRPHTTLRCPLIPPGTVVRL